MIPDFKTYIKESIWSDIQDRSAGEAIRKEDDINLLDFEGFYKYIEDRYICKVYNIDYTSIGGDGFQSCDVYITDNIRLIIKFYNDTSKEKKITFFWDTGIKQSFVDELGKQFNIDDTGYRTIYIFPKEGKVSNNFFIEILEFILKNKDNMLIESIWSDIQDRSSGETVREEDDVNRFGYEEFFVYLTEHYKPKSKKINEEIGGRTSIIDTDIIEIFVPIESIDGKIKTLIIEMSKKDNSIVSMATSPTLFDKYVNLERMLNNRYTLTTSRLSSRIYLRPKKKPTNRTIVDLIDTFLVVVDNPILEKVS